MKIVIISISNTYESLVPVLEEAGHTINLLTDKTAPVYIDENTSFTQNYIQGVIDEFEPDLVVNGMPTLTLSDSTNYTYFANTEESANLEINKWNARTKAGELGWLLPPVIEECKYNEVTTKDKTTFVKPKNAWQRSFKILRDENPLETVYFRRQDDCYVEQQIEYEVAGICHFTISNGEYKIWKVSGSNTTGEQKRLKGNVDWRLKCEEVPLTELQKHEFTKLCKKWLDYALTLGGTYHGELMGGITAYNQGIYWFEQNSRLSTFGRYTGTADAWIKSLTETPRHAVNATWEFFR